MIKKLCSFPNCTAYAEPNHIYCSEHLKQSRARHIAFLNAKRSNESLYNTQRWRTLRALHLKKNPFCVMCGSRKNLSVDHIVGPRGNEDLFFDENNLQTLCHQCHAAKTAQEIRERKNK